MIEKKDDDIIFFPEETTYKIGKTTYIVKSHYDENSDSLPQKIKKLLKTEIQNGFYKNL